MPGGRCATPESCCRVPGRQFRATLGVSGWMGRGALMNRQLPCPYCGGGRLWTVTRGFSGCCITVDLVGRLRASGVMLLDRVRG